MDTLAIYKEVLSRCDRFKGKGKKVPYTSANGHMFSFINKEGNLGMRFGKDVQTKYLETFETTHFQSHGATMRGYIQIPDSLLEDTDKLVELLNESYDYVMSLKPK